MKSCKHFPNPYMISLRGSDFRSHQGTNMENQVVKQPLTFKPIETMVPQL